MHKKANQTKTNQQNKNKQTKHNKGNNFPGTKTSKRENSLFCVFSI